MLLTAERVILPDGRAHAGVGIDIGANGMIRRVGELARMGRATRTLKGRVLLPGFVNAHSHAFQRLLRGRTQTSGPAQDSFWTWREAMYRVAGRLDPEALFVASRQAFLEMALSGVTSVGEFHYLHHRPSGRPYADPSELGDAVVRAAREVGIRLCLLRVTYLRGDFNARPSELQRRFCDESVEHASNRIQQLQKRVRAYSDERLSVGVAAHSLRAVPPEAALTLKVRFGHQPFHIHVSEQRKEVEGTLAHYGTGPVEVLQRHGLLDSLTTLVHATHLREGEAHSIAEAGATVCICPITEADLGDGLAPTRTFYALGVPVALGTDGQTSSSVLAEARRAEMHERLRLERRNVLTRGSGFPVAKTALQMATEHGARSLSLPVGRIAAQHWADFVAFNLDDPTLAGADDTSLLASLMFSADNRAVSDVWVQGRPVVEDGMHPEAQASGRAFQKWSRKLFADVDSSAPG